MATMALMIGLGAALAVPVWARIPETDNRSAQVQPVPSASPEGYQNLDTGGVPLNLGAPNGSSAPSGPAVQVQSCGQGLQDLGCNVQNFNASWTGFVAFMQNPFGSITSWSRETLFGKDFAGGIGGVVMGTPPLRSPSIERSWAAVLAAALVVMGLAVAFRVVKAVFQGEPFGLTIPAAVLRLAAVPCAMAMSLTVVDAAANFGKDMGGALFFTLAGVGGNSEWNQLLVQRLIDLMQPSLGLAGLTRAVLGLMVLYVVALMALRYVMLLFNAIIAPFAIAFAGFDTNQQLFKWWLHTTIGAAAAPMIVGAVGGLTLNLVAISSQGQGLLNDQVMPVVFAIGGLWTMGKLLHHFTFGAFHGKHFSAMLGGLEAGMLLPLRPMQMANTVGGVTRGFMGAGARAGSGAARGMISRGSEVAAAGADSEMGRGTSLWGAGFTAYSRGLWVNDIEGHAAASGLSAAPPEEKYEAFLGAGKNREIAYRALAPEHRPSPYRGNISTERFAALDWRQVSRAYGDPAPAQGSAVLEMPAVALPAATLQPIRPVLPHAGARLMGEADYMEELG